MGRSAKKTEAIWKDTDKYPFSIQYKYPLSIRNRCFFFWSTTTKGWKATINLADRLTEANRICVVYLFGEAKREIILRHIEKINNCKVIVLWADYIETEKIEIVMSGADTIKTVSKWGIGFKIEIDERNPYANNAIENDLHEIHAEQITEISEGRKALASIQEQIVQNGYENLSSSDGIVRADEVSHISELLKIIRGLYQYGIEADTQEEYAYKLLHLEKWCGAGIDGNTGNLEKLGVVYDDGTEPVQLSLFDTTSWGIIEFVKEFHAICDNEIERNGFVDLRTVFQHMQDAPYGMYPCNYYGLCIGIALQKYRSGYYVSGNLITQKSDDFLWVSTVKFVLQNEKESRSRPVYIYSQTEKQIELARKILAIFKPDRNVGVICLENVLTDARSWFNDNVMYDTVQRMLPELYEILSLWEPRVCSNNTEMYADWLTDEKAEQIKADIANIDKNFIKMLSDKYGTEKASLYAKSQGMRGGAVGWLHSVEMVDERVDNYMNNETVCRECGAIIHNIGYEVYENGFQGNRARLTKQNIINLNKKFLGRYQNEYFCLSCLCEALEKTEWEIYESMVRFKEQGCELFG